MQLVAKLKKADLKIVSLLIYKTKNNITDKESNSKNIGYRTDYTVINQVKTKRHISAFPNASYNMDDITAGHVKHPKTTSPAKQPQQLRFFYSMLELISGN